MPTPPPIDPAKEAADLISLAQWYRGWAELAASEIEKGRRLDMAIGLEKRARAMSPADGGAARADSPGRQRRRQLRSAARVEEFSRFPRVGCAVDCSRPAAG
jgi:hypothetical protein